MADPVDAGWDRLFVGGSHDHQVVNVGLDTSTCVRTRNTGSFASLFLLHQRFDFF